MSNKPIRKLTLSRETLRRLDTDALRWAAGGATETGSPPECIQNTRVTNETGGGTASGQCDGSPTWPSCDACGATVGIFCGG